MFAIETYFQSHKFIMLHTPAIASALIPERHIDVLSVVHSSSQQYLIPSPEVHIKSLLAQIAYNNDSEYPSVYEFSHSFRKEELEDAIHNVEFIMLEWYQAHATLQDALITCCEIIQIAGQILEHSAPQWVREVPIIHTMEEAFVIYSNLNLREIIECETGLDVALYANLVQDQHDTIKWKQYDWEDMFHYLLVEYVQPKLPIHSPVFLTHFPARVATLASLSDSSGLWSNRWELYIQGIEIANCYVEESDPDMVSEFMQTQQSHILQGKSKRKKVIPFDSLYFKDKTLPPYSGVAMGIERLVLCLCKSKYQDIAVLSDISALSWLQR